ncbi:PspC domain-containing protein [Chloroflexota bacterium]
MAKRLYRSRSDRMLWGVCGGLAQYFDLDPIIVRLIFVLLLFANGIGILIYIIMTIVVPREGPSVEETTNVKGSIRTRRIRTLVGIAFVTFGILFLVGSLNLLKYLAWVYTGPLLIIIVGLIIIFSSKKRK